MGKLMRPQDILLITLSTTLDVFEELHDPLGIMSRGYKELYGFVPSKYKKHHFNHLVWRNLKTGYIEKIIKNGIPYFQLTSKGKTRVKRNFSLFTMQKTKWDKKWRIVTFDIEELNRVTREILRKKLKELGFGMFQKSVYISPHNIALDLAEFIESKRLNNFVYVFEVSNIVLGNSKELAEKVWHLKLLNKRYQQVLEQIKTLDLTLTSDRISKLNHFESEVQTNERKMRVKNIQEIFIQLIQNDPFLPRELLPSDWYGFHARILMQKLSI